MGTVTKWNIRIPQLSADTLRCVYLYLPDFYELKPQMRYPVMYMFDGHNVFFDEDATYGKSWGMYEYMNKSGKELIIVAVECNHDGSRRLEEYSPVDFEITPYGSIKGRGAVYMDWLTQELKPYVDSHFRTLPDRTNTLICGSSMGGLMALYAACKYNPFFSRAACLSPSLWINPDEIIGIIKDSTIQPDTCVYMDYGSEEMQQRNHIADILLTVKDVLIKNEGKVNLRIVPDGTHSEASWERQIPVFMNYFGI